MVVKVDLEGEYRRHVRALSHYASVLVGPDEAMDVVNDAVANTLARVSLVNVTDIRAYWFQAVTFTASSWHRSRSRRIAREGRVSAHSPAVRDTPMDLEESLKVLAV